MVAVAEGGNGQGGLRARPVFVGAQREYGYNPASDITATELSDVLEFFAAGMSVGLRMMPPHVLDMIWNGLPAVAQRHFVVKEKSSIVIPHA